MHKWLFILCMVLVFDAYSQNTTNTWLFGNRAGLNFNTLPPQPLAGRYVIIEGSAVMSDMNGNLMFYSHGKSIFNKEHVRMQGGDNIEGDLSSTSNSLIVPFPGNDSVYFLFTIGAAGKADQGFRYNIIDMKLNNGLGRVTARNIFIDDNCYEKMAAVRHCNNRDVWITIRKWDSDEFHTYLVSETGLSSTRVVSRTGLNLSGYANNAIGQMKFSADGKKLAAVHAFEINQVEVMNFNNITGVLSSPVAFDPNTGSMSQQLTGVYGVAFSPAGNLLYVSSGLSAGQESNLYQFDVTDLNASAILASRQVIAVETPFNAGALQEARDGKIYFSHYNDSVLSVINDPNIPGAGCNYVSRAISFRQYGNQALQYGLPTFISSDVNPLYSPYDFSYTTGCNDFTAIFAINKLTAIDSVRWYFSDGTQSTSVSPVKTFPQNGNYKTRLVIFYAGCGGTSSSTTVIHDVKIGESEAERTFLRNDTTVCELVPFDLLPAVSANSYLWSTGSTDHIIQISVSGEYWLELNRNGCLSRDTFTLKIADPVFVNIGPDTSVCAGDPVTLSVADPSLTYLWSTGSADRFIDVDKAGVYSVEVRSIDGCSASDTLNIRWGDCPFILPNAFSPNSDSRNDYFYLLNGLNADVFKMIVFNRYGEAVFTSSDPGIKWDGTYKGKPQAQGVYTWVVMYGKENFMQTEKGTVLLIR